MAPFNVLFVTSILCCIDLSHSTSAVSGLFDLFDRRRITRVITRNKIIKTRRITIGSMNMMYYAGKHIKYQKRCLVN